MWWHVVGAVSTFSFVYYIMKTGLISKLRGAPPKVSTTSNLHIRHIISQCHTLKLTYKPTFWCGFSGRLMTIATNMIRDATHVQYKYTERETIRAGDGGSVSIDWSYDETASTRTPPVVIFVSGITSGSQAPYIVQMVKYMRAHGWMCACYVYRGMAGTEVTGNVAYYATFDVDLSSIILHISKKHLHSKICVVGVSLGAMITFNTLANRNYVAQQVSGAVCISMPWNMFVSSAQLYSGFDYWVFNRAISKALRRFAIQHFHLMQRLGVTKQEIDEITRIKAFDEKVITRMGGYNTVTDYYIDGSPAFKLSGEFIKTPLLAINAEDDSFSIPAGFPTDEELSRYNSKIALVKYQSGGHVGFASNLSATDLFINPLILDFLTQAIIAS